MDNNPILPTLEKGKLPLKRGRLIKSMADSTIRSVLDAAVELITNSDDSYSRLEQEGNLVSGKIEICLERASGGKCKLIKVKDEAGGIPHDSLKEAIEFGGETSGLKEGRTVRGLFGRGLKESIIALGKGTIVTLNNNILSIATIWYDKDIKDAMYEMKVPIMNPPIDQLQQYGIESSPGTVVTIEIENDDISYIPAKNKIQTYISDHFSLRDITSSDRRKATLNYREVDSRDKFSMTLPQVYEYPPGKIVFKDTIKLNGEEVYFNISQSDIQLDSPKNPNGKAGLLIKTEGAILDNQLFGYEVDPAGLYFFGQITCPYIAKTVRAGDDSIIDQNRGGLEWRHSTNKKLEVKAKEILNDLIMKKKQEMKVDKDEKVAEPIQQLLDKVCKELSNLAKEELEDTLPSEGEIEFFTIRPLFANIEPNNLRSFGVYAPKYLCDDEGTKFVRVVSSNQNIKVLNSDIKLDFYKNDPEVLTNSFKVIGSNVGEISIITANLGSLTSNCEVRIGEMKHGGKKRSRRKGGGGFFKKVVPAHEEEPIQRFQYLEGGIIKIFVKFPGIQKYIGENFEKIESMEGRAILSEIIIETFCRQISRQQTGKSVSPEIDAVIANMDRLRIKASNIVYDTIFRANLKEIL